jgi:Homeodomain-like domain-containing protein
VSEADRAELGSWLRSQRLPQALGMRARVGMLSAEGHSLRVIAARLGVAQRTVCLWRRRYQGEGLQSRARHAPPDRQRHAARVARSPGNRYRYAFLAHGRYPPLARHNFRMAANHGGCAPGYITDDHHRRLLSGDHLHHGLIGVLL